MTPSKNFEDPKVLWELLVRYMADECTAEEVQALSARLECDPETCDALVEISMQSIALHDLTQTAQRPVATITSLPGRLWNLVSILALAASIMLAFVFGWQWSVKEANRMIGHIEAASATLQYTSGRKAIVLSVGDSFSNGVLSTEAMETATVRLRDGTLLSLGTGTELSLFDDGQKRIELLRGTFTADVVPQPANLPMLVRTPTAEVEIVGTAFSLAVEADRTHLNVEEGLVRVRRLTDDTAVDVAEGREVIVSPNTGEPLTVEQEKTWRDRWSVDFQNGMPEGWEVGQWQEQDGVIRAVPTIDRQRNHAVMSNNAWRDGRHSLAALHDDSVLRVTLRREAEGHLDVVMCLRQTDGRSFVGNIFLRDRREWNELPIGEWRTLEFPISEFSPMGRSWALNVTGKAVFKVIFTTRHKDIGLCVRDIAIVRSKTLDPKN